MRRARADVPFRLPVRIAGPYRRRRFNWFGAVTDHPSGCSSGLQIPLSFSVVPVALSPRNSPPALYRNRTSARGPACLRGSDTAQAPLHLCSPRPRCAHVGATGQRHPPRERQRLEGPFVAPFQSAAKAARLHPSPEAAAPRHEKFLHTEAIVANGFQSPVEAGREIVRYHGLQSRGRLRGSSCYFAPPCEASAPPDFRLIGAHLAKTRGSQDTAP